MLRVIRKADIILFFVLLLSAGLSAVLFTYGASSGASVVITLDGQPYGSYSIDENREIEISGPAGHNTVLIENGTVRMKSSDCHNQICVEHAPVSRSGESIICLPHKLVVQIEGGKEGDVDAVAQ